METEGEADSEPPDRTLGEPPMVEKLGRNFDLLRALQNGVLGGFFVLNSIQHE